MFWRLLLRSLSVKRAQATLAIGSLVVGATVTSMLLNLYGDVRRKMTQEFRAYGANVVLAPAAMESLPSAGSSSLGGLMGEEVLRRLESIRRWAPGLTAAPLLDVIVRLKRVPTDPRLPESQNAVAVGTDFAALRHVFPSWRVEGVADALRDPGECAIGTHVAARLRLGVGDSLELETVGQGAGSGHWRRQRCRISSLLATGGSEDDQVFAPLASLERLAGLEGKLSMVELSVPGDTAEVQRVAGKLAQVFPDLEVRPIRQIVYSEGRVLGTIRGLMVSLTTLILAIIALCVAATMTAIVLNRRKDIAVMKALGASNQIVQLLFLSEGAVLGLVGGSAGFVMGGLLARHLAQRLFGVNLHLVWWAFPLVCFSGILLAVLAALFPVRMVRGIQPAVVLKGS